MCELRRRCWEKKLMRQNEKWQRKEEAGGRCYQRRADLVYTGTCRRANNWQIFQDSSIRRLGTCNLQSTTCNFGSLPLPCLRPARRRGHYVVQICSYPGIVRVEVWGVSFRCHDCVLVSQSNEELKSQDSPPSSSRT